MKKRKSNKDEVLAYMKKKYGENFEFYDVNTQQWNADYIKMVLFSKKIPNDNIVVHKNREDGTITDNYVAYLLEDKVEKLVLDLASQVYGTCKVFNIPSTSPLSPKISGSISLSNYVSSIESELEFIIFTYNSFRNKDDDVERFRKVLEDNLCDLYFFSIHYVKKSVFNNINKNNYHDYKVKPYSLFDGAFMLNNKYEFTYKRWGDQYSE
ncbi:hypothetical protein GC105_03555 [Alkalibaculum sp. M08DMB]|uniref:Uncharacterized protein n=1 Tax=Alkalibaculum sporogenes TaxID=2655001 RepID=A0A6A7K667_9FIRM|nr:hypothetical protein [Alkalibaculum sporogenes]MPW24865.1 hypothetical protein [Alkalibaculum sporogenes]